MKLNHWISKITNYSHIWYTYILNCQQLFTFIRFLTWPTKAVTIEFTCDKDLLYSQLEYKNKILKLTVELVNFYPLPMYTTIRKNNNCEIILHR